MSSTRGAEISRFVQKHLTNAESIKMFDLCIPFNAQRVNDIINIVVLYFKGLPMSTT